MSNSIRFIKRLGIYIQDTTRKSKLRSTDVLNTHGVRKLMSRGKYDARKYAILGVAILISSAIILPLATGDVVVNGNLSMTQTYVPPSITVNETNQSYKGATFVFNTTVQNGTTISTLQVHLNFKLNGSQNFTTLLLNVLQVFNTGNITGNFSVIIEKSAQAGTNKTLNSTYTDAMHVYMSHAYQNSSNMGTQLYNNTLYYFPFYPFDNVIPMYYIGMNYTEPPLPPSGTDINSIQQFITFTFTVVS